MADYNIDLKLTDDSNPGSFQFINMTVGSPPAGAQQLTGTWRGGSVFVPSSGGEFTWDGRAGHEVAFVFDGTSTGSQVVVGLLKFVGANGSLPPRGTKGGGTVLEPRDPSFKVDIAWEIT